MICLLFYSSRQTNQIRPFVFLENLQLANLLFEINWPLVSATYNQLYEAVVDPKNAYNNPELIVNKTPDQVDLLLHL